MSACPTLAERLAALEQVDALAAAARIVEDGDPFRAAIRLPAREIVAIAVLVQALDDAAATAYQLLAHIDALERARGVAPACRERALRDTARTLCLQLGAQLAWLGYADGTTDTITATEETT